MALGSATAWSDGVVWSLLQHPGLKCSIRDATQSSALHYAASNGSSAPVELLLSRGADTSAADSKGRQPLHLAAARGHLAVVKQLVAAGADVEATVREGACTPLLLAAAGAYGEVVSWLLSHGAAGGVSAACADGTTALHLACSRAGAHPMVQDLLAAGAAPAAADNRGTTPLHLAAAAGNQDAVRSLLAAGVPAHVANLNRELPMHLAISQDHSEVALLLLKAGAQLGGQYVNAVTAAGSAPIHLAAKQGSSIMEELLRCKDLQVDLVDGAGQTALLAAAAARRGKNLQLLLAHGASLDVKDDAGATPLHLAAAAGSYPDIKALVSAGADKDALDGGGATPLHRAAANIRAMFLQLLVPLLATPSNVNRVVHGTTLLHTAVAASQKAVVRALLVAGATPSCLDVQGESALTQAAQRGDSSMVSFLLHHLSCQHQQQRGEEGTPLPQVLVCAMQEAAANSTAHACCMWTAVMDVMGEDAATSLWQQLTQQHRSTMDRPHSQQQKQQGSGQERQRLGRAMMDVLLQGWEEACTAWLQQRKGSVQALAEVLKGITQQQAAMATGASPGAQQSAAVGAGAGGGSTAHPATKHKRLTIGNVKAAAGQGRQGKVQELLQQLPAGARGCALVASARAAAAAGHYLLFVTLAQQLAALDQPKALSLVKGVAAKLEGCANSSVKVLGPSSLELCAALVGGWQAVRRQQQQELVGAVVSAVVAWKQVQQEGPRPRQPCGAAKRRNVGRPTMSGTQAAAAGAAVTQSAAAGPAQELEPTAVVGGAAAQQHAALGQLAPAGQQGGMGAAAAGAFWPPPVVTDPLQWQMRR